MKITSVEFVTSAACYEQVPVDDLPQIAVAGRSNVGKSSLINYLLERRSMARTSGRPGHTRLLNFFLVNKVFYLVDLPGFGYAAVDRKTRSGWGAMVHEYLEKSPGLRSVLLLLDVRRELGEAESQLIAWLDVNGLPLLPVITKIDKLKPQARQKKLRFWREQLTGFGVEAPIWPVSALRRQGREALWEAVNYHLAEELP